MEGHFTEEPAQLRSRAGIQQSDPDILRAQAGRPDQWRVAFLAILANALEVQVRSRINQRLDKWNARIFRQRTLK